MDLNNQQFDYKLSHHAPGSDDIPMHQAEKAFPDIHARPRDYHHGDDSTYGKSLSDIARARNNPDRAVTMYRAMPREAIEKAQAEGRHPINPGDWVTTAKPYAQRHAMQDDDPKHDWPVVSKRAKAKHLRTEGNDVNEWSYIPD